MYVLQRCSIPSDRNWTAKPNVPWLPVVANASAGGSATLQFQVDPNPIGALDVRSGAIEIRCSNVEGQNRRASFLGCHSRDYSEVDWIFLAGVPSYISGEVNFGVRPNPSGVERIGGIVVGETRWPVTQSR
jgi:hypothetical protein